MAYFYLIIAIISEVIATISLKASFGFTKVYPTIIVIIGYIISFILFSLVLKSIPIGIAYSCWAGLGIVCITIIGYFLYNQIMDIFAIIGIGLIIIGILIINLLSKTTKY